ncbi:MAG TPA: riboflavin synthase [Gemmatimonadales bacterium]|nr:riboflavin synthase [Gemmatimonadales bacterium]
MFTGIITEVGSVARADHDADGLELTIRSSYSDLEPGESIAVDGACLTVQELSDGTFQAHVIRTSLDRTRFADYVPGQRVNLERALRLGDRLGGHLVQGHVDGLGWVEMVTERDDARLLNIRVPPSVGRTSVPQGSITVDGVSLTVNAKLEPDLIQISLIPFTLQHTTLGERRVGDRVHLEADTIGKYVEALWENRVNGQR